MTDQLVKYLLEAYSLDSQLSSNKLAEMDNEFKTYQANFLIENGTPFDLIEFLQNISPSCEEIILGCSFAGKPIANCCTLATMVQTDVGFCVRFNGSSLQRRQWFSGSGYGWQIVVDQKNHLKTDLLPELFSDEGIRVLVQESGKEVSLQSNGVSAPPGTALYAGIDAKNISLLRRIDWGVCQKTWDTALHGELLLPLNYTAEHCEWNCHAQKYMNNCGCVPINFKFTTNLPICTPIQLAKCRQNEETSLTSCNCDVECDMMEYNIQMSYADVSQRSLLPFVNLSQEYIENSVSVAWVYFRSISYERQEQQKQLQTADLLSNIAGSMGLFLGMSTVTLLEIFIYLFKSVWGTVNTERQNQFMQAMRDEEEEQKQNLIIVENPEDEKDLEDEPEGPPSQRRASRRLSVMPINIHIDRRGSRMVNRRDSSLFDSMPRRSISVAPQLGPSFGHRQSIAVGSLGRRGSQMEPSGDILPTRRGSVAPNRIELPTFGNLSSGSYGGRRKSSVNPKHFLL